MKKLGMSMVTILLAVVMLFTGMMPMESAKAAADPLPVTTVPGLTIDYIIDNLGDTLNYGLVAREYHQDNHAETSVCVDLLKKTEEEPFLNTSKTYSTGKPYTLYAAVSAPNGQSLDGMQFALCTRNGSNYTILEDEIVTVNTTSNVTTVGWNITTGSELLNETLYVRQVEWKNGAYQIVNEGTENDDQLTVTYGPKVVSSSPNSSYIGKMVCDFDNETIKFFDKKAPKPAITFGRDMDIGYYDWVNKGVKDNVFSTEYEWKWVSLREMDHEPTDETWHWTSWTSGQWVEEPTGQPVRVQIRYMNQEDPNGAQQFDQYFEDNIYYQYDDEQEKGMFYWGSWNQVDTYLDFTFTDETDRANQLLLSVEDFSAELGNIAGGTTQYYDPTIVRNEEETNDQFVLRQHLGYSDDGFKNISPSIYGNSTVTGPVDANGNVVSVYNIDANNWAMDEAALRQSLGYKQILIAPNEYVVFNVVCPAKGSKTGDEATTLTMLPQALNMYVYEAGKDEQATWPQNDGDPVRDTGSSDRVIFNFVYWDESENEYLPYEGIVNATSQHGGTLLAPKARVEVTRDPTNGAIIADSVQNTNAKEIHQRTLTNPSQGTWVHMVGREVQETGYIKIEKLNSEKVPVAGAVFGVYSNKACSADKLVASKATDPNGVALFGGLEPGTYYVKEISVPEDSDYVLDTNVYTVEVTAGVTTTVGREGYLINLKNKGYLKLTKVDEADTSKALPGAVFKLYKQQDGDTFNESTARLIKTFTTDAAGKINAQLEIGTYWLKEEKAPFGYAVSTPNVWPIVIEAEQTVVVETTDGSGVVTNAKLPSGTLKVTKVAAEDYDTKLENAEFTIYEDEACTEEVASFKTDYFGKASIEIPVGDYWVKETVTPAGREPDTKEYPVKITEGETTFLDNNDEDNEDYFTNEKQKKSIYLMKVGGDYINVAPLKGVKFGIYSNQSCNEADLVATAWTDSEGIARFSIFPGHYWLKEILAAPGYNILNDVKEIWVNESDENNKLIRGNYYNNNNGYEGAFLNMKNDAQTGRVRLYKENEEGVRLDGVQFGLYTDPNCAEESLYRTAFTEYKQGSKEHGKLEIPDVPYGTYYLKEIAPLDGYQANENIYTVVVNGNPSDVEGEKENVDGKMNIVVNKKITTTTTIDFTVTKVWPDGEPEGEAANVSASLRLYKGSDEEVTKDASGADLSVSRNGNQYTWNNLPAEENGQPIVYYVMETKLDGYAVPVYSNTDTTVKDKALNGGSIFNAKTVSATVMATKSLNNVVAPADQFSFTLTGEKVDASPKYSGADGKVEFAVGPFEAVGTYEYTLEEVIPKDAVDNKLNGVTYDDTEYTVVVTVARDAANKLVATVDYNQSTVPEFKNTYATELKLGVSKKLANWDYVPAGETHTFTFTLSAAENCPSTGYSIEDGTETITFTKTSDGANEQTEAEAFALNFTAANTYVFTVSETSSCCNAVEGDQSVYTVTVTVANNNGQLTATPVITKGESKDPVAMTFVNTLKTISIAGTKEWVDEENKDGKRPDSITINLLAGGQTTGKSVTLSVKEENNVKTWPTEWKFENLPKYDAENEEITYTVTEEPVEGYLTQIDQTTYKITNTKITDTSASITLLKTVNQLGNKTPADTTFYFEIVGGLQNNTGNQTGSNAIVGESSVLLPVKVTSGRGEETYTFNFAQDGTYIYEIHELKPDAKNELPQQPGFTYTGKKYKVEYLVELDDAALLTVNDETWYVTNENGEYVNMTAMPDSLEFINDYTLTDISVEKKWSDGETIHSKDSVQVQLYKTVGTAEKVTEGTPVTLDADKEWKHTWPNLSLRDDNGNAIVYTVDEVGTPAGYVKNAEKELEKDALGFHFKITNTKITDTAGELIINKTVKKTGDVEPNTTDAFTFSIEQVEKPVGGEQTFDKVVRTNGESAAPVALLFPVKGTYVYKVTEVIPEKEEDRLPGYTYDNTVYTVTFNVKQDDKTAKLTADAPVWTKNGTVDANVDSADFVNEYGMTSISGTKVWNDANNQDGVRPDSITIKLLAGGQPTGKSVTLTATNADASNESVWNWTFTDLPKYTVDTTGNATPIVYTVEEVITDDNNQPLTWTTSYTNRVITGDATTGYVITNTYAPGNTQVSVEKVWDDASNQDGVQPAEITVNLLAGGAKVDAIVLSAANSWKHTFTNLDKKANGQDIVYSVEEVTTGANGEALSWVQYYTGKVEENATKTGFVITNTHAPGTVNITVTKVWEDNNATNRPAITLTLYKGDNVVVTDAQGEKLAPVVDDNKYTWSGLPEKENGEIIVYYVKEDAAAQGYKEPVYTNTEANATVTDKALNGGTITNTLAEGEASFDITKTLVNGAYLAEGQTKSFTFKLYEYDNAVKGAEVATTTITLPAADDSTENVLGQIKFDLKFGTHTYLLEEVKGTDADIDYDGTQYKLELTAGVNQVENPGTLGLNDFKFTTMEGKEVTSLAFSNTYKYDADGKLHLEATKAMSSDSDVQTMKDDQFTFGIFKADVQVAAGTNTADGKILFDEISYDQSDIGATYLYTVKELPGIAEDETYNYFYDDTVYNLSVSVTDGGNGNLIVTKTITKGTEAVDAIVFTNTIKNKVGHIGVMKVDKADDKKGLADAVFGVYTQVDADGKIVKTSWVGDIRTGETGAGSLQNLPIGTYYVQESMAPRGYQLDETVYTVKVEEGETAMVNGEKVFNAKLGRLMLRKADRLNPDKALPGAVYTLYSDEACLPETKVADITTGDDGIGYLDDVAPGTYWVKETKAPVGYEVDPLPYKVVIEENPDPEKPAFVQVTDFPLRGALVISKTVVGVEETTETFLFDIELSIATADPIVGSYEATLNGVATEKVTFAASDKGAKATVSLKSGDTLAISGVREGVTYTVTEQSTGRYDVTVNNVKTNVATGTIKEAVATVAAFQNTLKQTGFTVEKVWQGAEGGEIELTLFANGVKVEPQPKYTKEGNKYSYADLTMVDEKGQEILYTVKETAMAGYTTSYKNIAPYADKTDCAYNGGQIINQALTSFSVKKEWAGLAEGETAPAIQLTLYCNGTIVTKATPKPDAKGWYVYTDLPATVEGKAAVYTVKEEPLSGYTTTYINKGENAAVTDCAYNGSTIVNSKIPQTGDGTPLALWMTTMLLAALGLVGLKAYSRKREN